MELLFNGYILSVWGFPGGSDGKEPACNSGDPGSIPGSGRSPGEGNGNPLQYSCLENSMDRRAWQATVHGFAKSQTGLSNKHEMSAQKGEELLEMDVGDDFITMKMYLIPLNFTPKKKKKVKMISFMLCFATVKYLNY